MPQRGARHDQILLLVPRYVVTIRLASRRTTPMLSFRIPGVSTALRPSRGRVVNGALALVKEVARHLLRRPVVGVAAAPRAPDRRWVLVPRADFGTWAL